MRNTRLPTRLLPLGLLGVAGLALAGTWSDFSAAFPGLPCQDGWAGCIVDGSPVSPGMVLDGQGRPHAADMRLGFFDFDALPSLSPFAGLSDYTGEGVEAPGDGDADDLGADAPPPAADPSYASAEREAARAAADAERAAQRSAAAASAEADARAEAEARARADQDAARRAAEEAAAAAAAATDAAAKAQAQARADAARRAADEAAAKAETERAAAAAARKAAEEEARKQARAEAASAAAEAEAKRVAEAQAKQAAEEAAAAAAKKAEEDAAAAAAASAAAAAAASATASSSTPVDSTGDAAAMTTSPSTEARSMAPATCDNLVALEVPAMMGQLGAGVRSCLEKSLASAGSQTSKDKISRVLIADAEARGDQSSWEGLMKRHLQDIDRSDPNLCFKYALHLSRGGSSRAFGVIRWADYALENKQQWSGATYTKNVNGLYKIRAQAANKLWQSAEQKLVDDRSDENEAASEKYRGQTKDYAREWLDYARASGQEISTAMALCVSAAGNKEFCGG